ncbi:hypothetical protein BGV53_29555 [Burkholderia ubonensis]|nr:hypothetical protein WM15_10850 [Burkholderia ubonensis]OJB10379.1 hypothetical protein BGV53_29555 [Burkholderia ubonensis]
MSDSCNNHIVGIRGFSWPYSPHLNPDEQVWAHVKRSVSKRLVQTKDEMKRLAINALRRIQKLSALVKSFFRQPECQYAAM